MSVELTSLFGVLFSLGGPALAKHIAKKKDSKTHKWLAPVVAVASGVGYTMVTKQEYDMLTALDGVATGSQAVLLHQLYKVWRDNRRYDEK